MLNASVLALTVLAGQTWTVSNDGRADFSEIGAAIADSRVAIGDILLVSPGEYDGFALDRDLTIVGAAGVSRPIVEDPVMVTPGTQSLGATGGFAFGFIQFEESVTVNGIPGAGRFDNCRLLGSDDFPTALRIFDSADVTLSRCELIGADADADSQNTKGFSAAGDALFASNSNLVFVDTEARGGNGLLQPGANPNAGGDGAVFANDSSVLMAGGAMLGGLPGGNPQPCNLGPGGHGLVLNQSTSDLRGFSGNNDRILPPPPPPCGPPAFSILALGPTSKVRIGGPLALRGISAPPNAVETTTLLQPYLQNNGADTPGSSNVLRLRGEASQFAFFLGSTDTTPTEVPELDLPLGFDPGQTFFVGGLLMPSQALLPANCPYDVPPNAPVLDGMAARFQCVLPNQPSQDDINKSTASNFVDVVIRF